MKSLNETIEHMKILEKFKRIFKNSVLQESLIDELELNENSKEVLELIQSDNYEKQNPKEFIRSLKSSKYLEMLSDYSVSELSKMKLFKVPGFNIGFALKKKDGKFNEIVAVHNNEQDIKGVGKELMKSAIRLGGEYLDHFDGYLSNFYKDLGFVEYSRDKFDPQYDVDGSFRKKYGEADVIYRKLKK